MWKKKKQRSARLVWLVWLAGINELDFESWSNVNEAGSWFGSPYLHAASDFPLAADGSTPSAVEWQPAPAASPTRDSRWLCTESKTWTSTLNWRNLMIHNPRSTRILDLRWNNKLDRPDELDWFVHIDNRLIIWTICQHWWKWSEENQWDHHWIRYWFGGFFFICNKSSTLCATCTCLWCVIFREKQTAITRACFSTTKHTALGKREGKRKHTHRATHSEQGVSQRAIPHACFPTARHTASKTRERKQKTLSQSQLKRRPLFPVLSPCFSLSPHRTMQGIWGNKQSWVKEAVLQAAITFPRWVVMKRKKQRIA